MAALCGTYLNIPEFNPTNQLIGQCPQITTMNKTTELTGSTSTNTQVTTVCAKELRGEAGCKEVCDECKRKEPKETMIYVETPISEKPEKEGRYIVNNGLGFFEVSWNEHYGFHEEFTDCSGLTYWLKPVEGADVEQELYRLWVSARNYEHENHFGRVPNKYPDFNEYIKKLKL